MQKTNSSKRTKNKLEINEDIEIDPQENKKFQLKTIEKQYSNFQNIFRCPECFYIPLIYVKDNENRVTIDCLKGHHKEMLFSDFMTNEIEKNEDKISCSKCGIIGKNIFKICEECVKIFCKDCKNIHDKKFHNHHLISCQNADICCSFHKLKYTNFCETCKINLCDECLKYHYKNENHKIILYDNINLTKDELEEIKIQLIKENEILYKIKKIFNDTLTILTNKFNDIISYKFLCLKYKNNIVYNYEIKDTNYQVIDNLNRLKYITDDIKIEPEMNELDIIYELFNFLDSVEYNDNENNKKNQSINSNNSNKVDENSNENEENEDYENSEEKNEISIDENEDSEVYKSKEIVIKEGNNDEISNEHENFENNYEENIDNDKEINENEKEGNYNENYGNSYSEIDESKEPDINEIGIQESDFNKKENKNNIGIYNQGYDEEDEINEKNKNEDEKKNNIYNDSEIEEQKINKEENEKNITNEDNIENINNIFLTNRKKSNKEKEKEDDTFCYKIKPKKEITNVESENYEKDSQEKKTLINPKIENNEINGNLQNNEINIKKPNPVKKKKIGKKIVKKKLNIINQQEEFKTNESTQKTTISTTKVTTKTITKKIIKDDETKNNFEEENNINNLSYNLNSSNKSTSQIEVPNTNYEEENDNLNKHANIIKKKKKKKLNIEKKDSSKDDSTIFDDNNLNEKKNSSCEKIIYEKKQLKKENNENLLEKDIINDIDIKKNDNHKKLIYTKKVKKKQNINLIKSMKSNEKNINDNNDEEEDIENNFDKKENSHNEINDENNNENNKSPTKKKRVVRKKKITKTEIVETNNNNLSEEVNNTDSNNANKSVSTNGEKTKQKKKKKKKKLLANVKIIAENTENTDNNKHNKNYSFDEAKINDEIIIKINIKSKSKNPEKETTKISPKKRKIHKTTNINDNKNELKTTLSEDNILKKSKNIKNQTMNIVQNKKSAAILLNTESAIYIDENSIKTKNDKKNVINNNYNFELNFNKPKLNHSVENITYRKNNQKKDEDIILFERSNSYRKMRNYIKFNEREKINSVKFENGVSCILEITQNIFSIGNLIGDLIIFNSKTLKEIQTIREHDGTIISLCLLHDKGILSCSADRIMKKIRLSENGQKYKVEFIFEGYENYILKGIELKNSFNIVTCSWDDKLFVWDFKNNTYEKKKIFNKGERVQDLLEINDNYFVSISDNNNLKFWNSENFELIDIINNIKCIGAPNALCKLNDVILSVLDYHEIQLVDLSEKKLINNIMVDDGNLSCIIKLNDNSLLVAEDFNTDTYCVFYMKQFYYEQGDLQPVSYKKDKFYKSNKNNDKEIRALAQFSNGIIVQGVTGEYNGKDSGDLFFYY